MFFFGGGGEGDGEWHTVMGEIHHIYRGWVCCESALKAELPWAVRKLQL